MRLDVRRPWRSRGPRRIDAASGRGVDGHSDEAPASTAEPCTVRHEDPANRGPDSPVREQGLSTPNEDNTLSSAAAGVVAAASASAAGRSSISLIIFCFGAPPSKG